MVITQKTIFSDYLQTCLLTGSPFTMAPNSTLNELFNVEAGIAPSGTPTLGYVAIGNGGHTVATGANGIPLVNPIQHKATDAALFKHLPFVLREVGNDLDIATAANYALRRLETHNGIQYIAYYLMRLPMNTLVPDMEYVSVANGTSTTTQFVPTSSNLNPVPPVLNNSGVNIVSGDYVASSAKITITLTPTQITEILNMATILYGDPSFAIISELALCSGVDKVVSSPSSAGGNGASIQFNEAIAVQALSFVSSFFALEFNQAGVQLLIDCGSASSTLALV